MNTKDKLNKLEYILSLQLQWINSSDTKSIMMTPILIAMLGVLAVLAEGIFKWNTVESISSSFALFFLGLSFLFIVFASFPRTDGPRGSIIFCGGICTYDSEKYIKELNNLSNENFLEDMARQCHRNGEIAARKFNWIRKAFVCFYLSIIPWLLSIYSLYQVRALHH